MSASPATGPILATKALAKRYGGVVATDSVDLGVADRELRCIIGPNGAGKSTLFKLLCGLEAPDQGRVYFKGADVSTVPAFKRVRMGLGMTFQTNRTYHALTVRQNLETPLRVHRADRSPDAEARYAFALERFGLDATADHAAKELPHHRLQWLEIAMVLAGGPDVLLLDEPTAGMSPEETRATAAVLKDLNARGLTIVVVEHDIAFVREVASRVTVLHQGRVFAEGTIDEITAHDDVRRIYLGRA